MFSFTYSAIVNNIIAAVEKSRRTILLLTPSYIQSNWTQFEYAVAHHRMIEKKIQIVPIILEDISKVTNIQKGLRHILDTITYIEWPGSDNSKKLGEFWERLRLSMPKFRSSSRESLTINHSSKIWQFGNFQVPSSSSESSPLSTPHSEHRSYLSSRQPSIRSTLSTTFTHGSFRHKDVIISMKSVKSVEIDSLRSNDNNQIAIPMKNTESDTPSERPDPLEEPDENHKATEHNPTDVTGSSMHLLGSKASGAGRLKIVPRVIIDGSSSPPTDITCCSFVQSTV